MHKEDYDRALRTHGHQPDVGEGAFGELFNKFGLAKKLFGFALMIGRLRQPRDAIGKIVSIEVGGKIDDPCVRRWHLVVPSKRIKPDHKHSNVLMART